MRTSYIEHIPVGSGYRGCACLESGLFGQLNWKNSVEEHPGRSTWSEKAHWPYKKKSPRCHEGHKGHEGHEGHEEKSLRCGDAKNKTKVKSKISRLPRLLGH